MKILDEIMARDRDGAPVTYRDLQAIQAEVEKMEARAHLASLQSNAVFRMHKDRIDEVVRLHQTLDTYARRCNELEVLAKQRATEEEALGSRAGQWVRVDNLLGLIKELDVALNGAGGATHPRLADIVSQAEALRRRWGVPLFEVLR